MLKRQKEQEEEEQSQEFNLPWRQHRCGLHHHHCHHTEHRKGLHPAGLQEVADQEIRRGRGKEIKKIKGRRLEDSEEQGNSRQFRIFC